MKNPRTDVSRIAGFRAASRLRQELLSVIDAITELTRPVENVRVLSQASDTHQALQDHVDAIDGLIYSEYGVVSRHGDRTPKKKSGGFWRTTEDGNKIYIKDGEARGGGPSGPELGPATSNDSGKKPGPKPDAKKPKEPPKQPVANQITDSSKAKPIRLSETSIKQHAPAVKEWERSLTAEDENIIKGWSVTDYTEYRENFKAGKIGKDEENLMNILNRGGNVEATAYRGIKLSDSDFEQFKKSVQVGSQWSDAAPSSSSLDPEVAAGFMSQGDDGRKQVMVKLNSKTGTYVGGVSLAKHEKELVLRPGVKYRVVSASSGQSIKTKRNLYKTDLLIELEEILP